MRQTQTACISEPEIYARRFFAPKGIKALTGKSYRPEAFEEGDHRDRLS